LENRGTRAPRSMSTPDAKKAFEAVESAAGAEAAV
jgi:hypothetical protein